MADMTDVADVLVGLIAAAVYPNGTTQPPAGGVQAKIYQGWPDPAQLQADLKAKIAHVTVWPTPTSKITTRRIPEWQVLTPPAPTLAAAVAGTSFTLSGTVSTPQAVALIIDGKDYARAVQVGDTLDSIAAAMATLIAVDQPASAVGAVVTIPGSHQVIARIVANGTSAKEVARETRIFKISIWADCFERREPLAKVIGPMLAGLTRLAMPDGTDATVEYAGSAQVDTDQKQGIFRRDIDLAIDYGTIVTRTDNTVGILQTRPALIVDATVTVLPIINQ
ncbi:hypothetical protein J7E70_02230 [Variovorax paradoxus]|nr:hypothetical protein [Variovorax paradoxus]MBT2299271.1 hypothetical protein [Variovorax paradoxus]